MNKSCFDPDLIKDQDKMILLDAELRKKVEKQNEETRKDLKEVEKKLPESNER